MKEILVFGGTTEGRKLSEYLAAAGIGHTICVATEYGENILQKHPLVKVHQGRMDSKEISTLLENGTFAAVVDATHPFAKEITENIKAAAGEVNQSGQHIPYLRLKRDSVKKDEYCQTADNAPDLPQIVYFETDEACAQVLTHTKGNILLTTGSKELVKYCVSADIRSRLYVRALPVLESLSLCMEQGICGKQIIAMQGPFTAEMNEAVIRQYQISYLVTKESGRTGGYQEKLEAAKRTGIQVFVIVSPKETEGYSFAELCGELEKICGNRRIRQIKDQSAGQIKDQSAGQMEILLAGFGMGHENCMTAEVREAVSGADIILGAQRMLAGLQPKLEKRPFYQAQQILPYLKDVQERNLFPENLRVVILFSGDSGFYSGCASLYAALDQEIREGQLRASLRILPGISSVAYLASRIGQSYEDASVCSMHGKKPGNLIRTIACSPKTFLLTSGVNDVILLGRLLTEAGMSECEITAGYQLSYAQQQIRKYTPWECCELKEEGLYTCFVKNPRTVSRRLTHGMPDDQFIRHSGTVVPMTKEEVREVSICKLRLHEGAVVYDIGSGTGSVAAEMAALSDTIQVFAIEKKKEAISLIEQNILNFHLKNITLIEAEAPEGLSALPIATHAFIGGSGGRLKEILMALQQANSRMRIVINAVSMETICEIKEVIATYPIENEEIIQLQVSRARRAGNYHLMQSQNPVWIFAFNFCGSLCG